MDVKGIVFGRSYETVAGISKGNQFEFRTDEHLAMCTPGGKWVVMQCSLGKIKIARSLGEQKEIIALGGEPSDFYIDRNGVLMKTSPDFKWDYNRDFIHLPRIIKAIIDRSFALMDGMTAKMFQDRQWIELPLPR